MRITILLILTALSYQLSAQKYTISGYVADAASGEPLINATIFNSKDYKGTISNNYGFYSLTLETGEVVLNASFIGYTPFQTTFKLTKDTLINVNLSGNLELDEVTITESRVESNVESTQMSVVDVPIRTIKSLPVLLGEVDILKTIQLLPGVQSGTEGTSGFYVRGGGPDQNLILLDGVPVYNANHLFGFFSVFNADAIQNVQLIKGGFPARYGGRLSSVLDIRMKEGNMKKLNIEGSVGIISSKLTIEGPIWKDRTSFIVSGRRTYIDVLAQPIIAITAMSNGVDGLRAGYFFHDFNAKLNHRFSDRSRLYLSAYTGKDEAYVSVKDTWSYDNYKNDFSLNWGNLTSALRWNYKISEKLFSNTTLTYSNYTFNTGIGYEYYNQTESESYKFDYLSGIEDYAGKFDIDYIPTPNHYIRAGISATRHTFKPGVNVLKATTSETAIADLDTTFGSKNIPADEFYIYVEDDIKIGQRFKINLGVHASGFMVQDEFYTSVQPRASMRYLVNENLSLKAAYTEMTQYIHLLSNSSIGLPTDLWLPVTDSIKPQNARQIAAGFAYTHNQKFDISVEGYYKTLENIITYKEGASFLQAQSNWEQKVEIGEGWSYGAEFLLEKKTGKTTGWIGYTLSWSWRQFDNLNFGEPYPYKYDRRHDIGIAITHSFTDKIDFGLTWVYGTGNAVTLATEKYWGLSEIGESYNYYQTIEYFDKRNNFRQPAYHRLDLGVNFMAQKKWGQRTWSFGAYNAYNNKNPFFLNFESRKGRMRLIQYSLFPIIPSISYQFNFTEKPKKELPSND